MMRSSHLIAVTFVALVGVWGCSRGTSAAALAERIKMLEAKCTRLESDFRAAAASRDELRTKLSKSEDQIAKLQLIVKERDELKSQVAQRVTERDQAVAQFETFRRSIRDLLGQADSAAMKFSETDTPVVTISARPAVQDLR